MEVTDGAGQHAGTLVGWSLEVYGAAATVNDAYIYTNEFSTSPGSSRSELVDTDGGIDTINAAAVTSDSTINLNPGAQSLIAGRILTVNSAIEKIVSGDGDDSLVGNAQANSLMGGRGDDRLDGGDGDDFLDGGTGNDQLAGGGGVDLLDGGKGNDQLTGGSGADVFRVGRDTGATDIITDFQLSDKVALVGLSTQSASRFEYLNFQSDGQNTRLLLSDGQTLLLQGILLSQLTASNFSFAFQPTTPSSGSYYPPLQPGEVRGSPDADQLAGNRWANLMDGREGADVMSGRTGDDIYVFDNLNDVAIELPDEGFDEIHALVNVTAPENVEVLVLKGSNNLSGNGNSLDNRMYGNAGNNVLNGGAGNDLMRGGLGNDTYHLDSVLDQAIEYSDEGTDTVVANFSFMAGAHFENITLTGVANLVAYGNLNSNVLIGNAGANTLWGEAGNDALDGGAGADTLWGEAGNDTLDGGTGSDNLQGGAGDDIYVVDSQGDVVVELNGNGTDTVRSSVAWTLGPNVEKLILEGVGAIGGIGNEFGNSMVGNGAANALSGGLGNDTLQGGLGADSYVFSQGAGTDLIIEELQDSSAIDQILFDQTVQANLVNVSNAGNDLILKYGTSDQITVRDWLTKGASTIEKVAFSSGLTWDVPTLLAKVSTPPRVNRPIETMVVQEDVAFSIQIPTDTIIGNNWGPISYSVVGLSGWGPSWTFDPASLRFTGIGGNSYVGTFPFRLTATDVLGQTVSTNFSLSVVNVNDAPVATNNQSSVGFVGEAFSRSLYPFSDEDAGDFITYTATLANGAPLPSWLNFNSSTRTISGTPDAAGPIDIRMVGTDVAGSQASTVVRIVLNAVRGQIKGTSGNDSLNGTTSDEILWGYEGNDNLNGGGGANTHYGGAGNDTYVVSSDDQVIELPGEGTDMVRVVEGTYTLPDNVEQLTLSGMYPDINPVIEGNGNALNNSIFGNGRDNLIRGFAGNDTLDGGTGNDTMMGGIGNDTYYVDSAGDVLVENSDEGIDTIVANMTAIFVSPDNIEN